MRTCITTLTMCPIRWIPVSEQPSAAQSTSHIVHCRLLDATAFLTVFRSISAAPPVWHNRLRPNSTKLRVKFEVTSGDHRPHAHRFYAKHGFLRDGQSLAKAN